MTHNKCLICRYIELSGMDRTNKEWHANVLNKMFTSSALENIYRMHASDEWVQGGHYQLGVIAFRIPKEFLDIWTCCVSQMFEDPRVQHRRTEGAVRSVKVVG